MGEREKIVEYIGRIQVVVNVMRACDKIVIDQKIVEKILRTLTPQYDCIVVTIEECKDLKALRVQELQNSLKAHEQRLIEIRNADKGTNQGTNQALQTRFEQKIKGRGVGRGRGRSRSGRGGGRNINSSKQSVEENGSDQREVNKRGGRLSRKHHLMLKAPLARNKAFKVNLNATAVQCLSTVNVEEEGWLWHYRFGHLNFKSFNQLNGKEMVKGVPLISTPNKICEGCAVRKQNIKKFKKSAPKRAKQPLDVI